MAVSTNVPIAGSQGKENNYQIVLADGSRAQHKASGFKVDDKGYLWLLDASHTAFGVFAAGQWLGIAQKEQS